MASTRIRTAAVVYMTNKDKVGELTLLADMLLAVSTFLECRSRAFFE